MIVFNSVSIPVYLRRKSVDSHRVLLRIRTFLIALLTWVLPAAVTAANPPISRPDYEVVAALNRAESWQAPADGVTISDHEGQYLQLAVAGLKTGDTRRVLLRQPVALDDGVRSVNDWICFRAAPEEFGVSFAPVFADTAGKAIVGSKTELLSSHIGGGNGRKAGLWIDESRERDPKAVSLIGFDLEVYYVGSRASVDTPRTVYLRDIALERLDYAKTKLYYVVGNYRDNFDCTGFNGCRARALTEQTGASDLPWILLDNVLDQAKFHRPSRVRLDLFTYDIRDRLVYAQTIDDLPTVSPPDFFTKIPIPITEPGTYRIQGKSFDAATGEYFTTDWTKLIILKGAHQELNPVAERKGLAINPDAPYGVIERGQGISFRVGDMPARSGPLELRYSVLPYNPGIMGWEPCRTWKPDHTEIVTAHSIVLTPHQSMRTAELVVADLWRDGHRIDHEERPLGVRNGLPASRAGTRDARVPSLEDQAGVGHTWLNVQFHIHQGENVFDIVKRNVDEVKKLTPNLGFSIDLNRIEPMPGVYDWDYLTPIFDLAEQRGCRIIPYLALKWPVDWAPIEFQVDNTGCAHRVGTMWGYLVGKYLYPNGEHGPRIIHDFLQQLARRYRDHPGLGGYYLENEHIDTQWMAWPVSRSYHEAYRKRFAAFVAGRYENAAALDRAYGTHYRTFEEVELPDPASKPRRIALVDFRLFQRKVVEGFVLDDEFDAIRREDPSRPIIVYQVGEESDQLLRHIAQNGGMMANGGVHSNFNTDHEYERMNAIPSLRCRMEPHDMWNYDPMPNGFDEMIFGMLAMGGRGMNFHVFLLGGQAFSFDQAMQPGQKPGLDKLVKYGPMLRELRDANKLHDPIGIMGLRGAWTVGEPWEWTIWHIHCALYALRHYSPRVAAAETLPSYLDGSKVIFLGGSVIDSEQVDYLKGYLAKGGRIVMEDEAGKFSLENPDAASPNALLTAIGIKLQGSSSQVPGLSARHDLYASGAGQVLIVHGHDLWNDKWEAMIPAIMDWAGVQERLADSDDRYMQIHVLQNGPVYYMPTTHRGSQQSGYEGPHNWSGQVRFLHPLLPGQYHLTEMMSGADLGVFTPAQLAAGFDAGPYTELQMKIFKIAVKEQ